MTTSGNKVAKFEPSKVTISEEADGFHWNYDNQATTLDARGKGYPSKAAAMRAAREEITRQIELFGAIL
jgi:hypothetical protein